MHLSILKWVSQSQVSLIKICVQYWCKEWNVSEGYTFDENSVPDTKCLFVVRAKMALLAPGSQVWSNWLPHDPRYSVIRNSGPAYDNMTSGSGADTGKKHETCDNLRSRISRVCHKEREWRWRWHLQETGGDLLNCCRNSFVWPREPIGVISFSRWQGLKAAFYDNREKWFAYFFCKF
jgi:hypothetical protein